MDNDSKPLVSIISLTYNHAPYIRECLDGFLMQKTDFQIEVIIHDDASTDGTTDIVKEYAEKYQYVQNRSQSWTQGNRPVSVI